MKIFAATLFSVLAFSIKASSFDGQAGLVAIDRDSKMLIDAEGRSLILHGVNAVYKVPPYLPSNKSFDAEISLSEDDINNLVKWGFNFVRLGVMWEAVEKSEGIYDLEYINAVKDLVEQLGRSGIYTLIEGYQFNFAKSICGVGLPNFYSHNAIGDHPACLIEEVDWILSPLYKNFKFCQSFEDFEFQLDANDEPIINDCRTQ